MDTAQTSRPAPPLLSRLAAASPWSRGRIAGEAVLLLVLAGIAGTMYGAESGSAASGGAVALLVALLSLVRRSLPATVLLASCVLAGSVLGCGPLLIYASWSAGSRIRRPWRAVGAYAAGLVLYVVPALLADGGEGIPGLSLLMTAVLGGGPYLALAVVPGLASGTARSAATCWRRCAGTTPNWCASRRWWRGRRGCWSGSGSPRTCTTASATSSP